MPLDFVTALSNGSAIVHPLRPRWPSGTLWARGAGHDSCPIGLPEAHIPSEWSLIGGDIMNRADVMKERFAAPA